MLERTFVREQAYFLLRDWIIQGKLAPQQKLRDKELASQLGVSRTPIREALLRLEDEGFVVTKPNRSTLVASLEVDQATQLYSIVWTLEKLALEQAFESITQTSIDSMTQANEKLLDSLKNRRFLDAIDADDEFHSIYIQLTKNRELIQIISLAKQKINRLKSFYFRSVANNFSSHQEHLAIINALSRKKLPHALKAVEANWKASCSRIQSQQDEIQ